MNFYIVLPCFHVYTSSSLYWCGTYPFCRSTSKSPLVPLTDRNHWQTDRALDQELESLVLIFLAVWTWVTHCLSALLSLSVKLWFNSSPSSHVSFLFPFRSFGQFSAISNNYALLQPLGLQITTLGKLWRRKWHPTPVLLLENPVDGGAWWAAVHRVTQSQTRLKRLSVHACIGE